MEVHNISRWANGHEVYPVRALVIYQIDIMPFLQHLVHTPRRRGRKKIILLELHVFLEVRYIEWNWCNGSIVLIFLGHPVHCSYILLSTSFVVIILMRRYCSSKSAACDSSRSILKSSRSSQHFSKFFEVKLRARTTSTILSSEENETLQHTLNILTVPSSRFSCECRFYMSQSTRSKTASCSNRNGLLCT